MGNQGSLFQARNEKIQARKEAMLVENRVKVLLKEEERMMKKIGDARKQAEKMQQTREENDNHYRVMLEFREKQ
eukprot:CAMPEP_0170500454 /NCGR_PEP_ID=MMETSP0208-20121228/34904_1 /TAXON_ID=197538 /ORGANISM="Strombidium inclinatum, Strain S3" /LENGTH=73 /DNA_ID=CAMNT_0010778503 /DNA_START=223 /DNA_END=444 /DNA_ORIENTATION=+